MPRPPNQKKHNTIEAVAVRAGVSTMTVSRVLRGTDKVALKTQKKVNEAIEELGYVHNRLAGALASSRSAQVAVIVSSVGNIVFTEVLAGIAHALDGSGYQPVIGICEYDAGRELDLVRSMLAWRPAGFILAHTQHKPETVQLLRTADIPVVELMALAKDPIDMCIGLDHEAVGHSTAEHVLGKGYRRFGYLGSNHDIDVTAAVRFNSFKKTVEKAGGEILKVVTVNETSGISLGRRHMHQLAEGNSGIELVYFSNDAVAAGAMMYCQANNINIPGDLALASFSGLEIAGAMPIPITTIKSPRFDMGRIGAENILRRLSGEKFSFVKDAGFELEIGESC